LITPGKVDALDPRRFAAVIRSLRARASRRTILGSLVAGLGLAPGARFAGGAAKKKKRKKKKKQQQQSPPAPPPALRFNVFGCVDVGGLCQDGGNCCSGRCVAGACQGHGGSSCQLGHSQPPICTQFGTCSACTTSTGKTDGCCVTTTGLAPYCGGSFGVSGCKKDADCVVTEGPDAACVFCGGGTTCVGP
jgi:hypothetical protein